MKRSLFATLRPLMPLAGLCLVAGASGCSSSSGDCTVTFAGDVAETGAVASGCGTLSADTVDGGAAGYALKLRATSAHIAALDVTIDLGASPSKGMRSSETVSDWSAVGLAAGSNDAGSSCGYGAGSDAVPTGSFTLTLTDVTDGASGRAVHGTLDMTLYVHAPPMTDCGAVETETVTFTF